MLHRKISIGIVIAVVSLLVIVLAGAGYSNGELPSQTPTPTPAVTTSTGTSPTPTPTPTPEPTPTLTPTQEMPKPSVPEFTVTLTDSSYDVPTTYYMDTYGSGKNETIPGYHVEARTITVTIKNQPFTPFPYYANSPRNVSLMYDIRVKTHYEENWTNIYHPSDGYPLADLGSEYTAISFQGEYSPESGLDFDSGWRSLTFLVGAQIDFQVEAMIGHISRVSNPNATNQLEMYPYMFIGEKSSWSDTATLTIPTNTPLLSVLSPQENSHSASDVPLTFSVDRPVSQLRYSLDDQENVTISGNTTLTALSNGLHSITVFAWDAEGNVGASETIHFETASPPASSPTSPSPLPTQTEKTPFVDPPEDTFSLLLLVFLAVTAIVTITVAVIVRKNSSRKTFSRIAFSLKIMC